jgi:hypothetical protein
MTPALFAHATVAIHADQWGQVQRSSDPVGYATDPKRHLSATPSTPLDDVDGVADRLAILSMA